MELCSFEPPAHILSSTLPALLPDSWDLQARHWVLWVHITLKGWRGKKKPVDQGLKWEKMTFQTLFDVSSPLLSVLLFYRAAPWIYTHFFPGCFHGANYSTEVFAMMQTVRYNFHQSGLHPAPSSSDMQASPFLHLKAQNMVVDLLSTFLCYMSFKCNPGHYSATKKRL